jgi:hypothetical protein
MFKSKSGCLEMWFPCAGIMATRVTGHLDSTMHPAIISEGTAIMSAGHTLLVFHDWLEMKSYDTKSRVELTEWTIQYARRIEKAHILLKSKLVAMGVASAAALTNQAIESYVKPDVFNARLEHEIKRRSTSAA